MLCSESGRGFNDVSHLGLATLSWVHWCDNERLQGHCADVPPAEFEAVFYAAEQADRSAVGIQ